MMFSKKWNTLLLLVVFCLCQGTSLAAPRKKLDVRTMGDWSIVLSETAIESEKYAAEEFRDFFAQATGHRLTIRSDSASDTKNVYIGASNALKHGNLAHALDREYAEEELRIIIATDNVAIVGGRPRGVLYGVYQFLDEVLRVRFLAPDVTHVPQYLAGDADKKPGQLELADYTYNPPIVCRYVGFNDFQDNTGRFAARLRANGRFMGDTGPTPEWTRKVGGHNRNGLILHNIGHWVPFKVNENPEYFAADENGKRGHSSQPCFSHPAVIKGMTDRILEIINRDYGPGSMIPIAHADGALCYCKRCQDIIREDGLELEGISGESSGAPMFLAINHIAREVAKVRPNVTIGTYAYTQSAVPPRNIKMEPNVRIQYATYNACQIHSFESVACPQNLQYCEDIRRWGEISNGMMYWYYGMGSFTDFFAPPLVLRMAGPHIRTLVDCNGKSFFIQGDPIMFAELVQYVYAKILWDPRLGTYELISEFIDLYYGPAAEPVAEFLRLADAEIRRSGKHINCNVPDIFKGYNYSQALGWKGIEMFDEALKLANTPELKARVEKASLVPYRMSLGVTWFGRTPDRLTDEDKALYRHSARKVFELCEKHNIVLVHEARRVVDVNKAIRKSLEMTDDELF